jgi:membrane protease YdiL (CAAX protease family)
LMKNYKSWYAILLSGILFSVFHLNPWQMTYTFFLGLFLGWLMVRTRSLPLCIIAHSINNIIVLFSITSKQDLQDILFPDLPKIQYTSIFIAAIIIGIILIILLSSKNKRSVKGNVS